MNEKLPQANGEVGILNVGDGDTKLSFDPSNPAERIRAARIVKDMLRRGYALIIETEVDGVKKHVRATDFNEDVCEYIIADFDPITAAEADQQEEEHGQQIEAQPGGTASAKAPGKKRGPKPRTIGVPATQARAVAVAPIAGG